jgi:hypothetical protein
MTLTLLRKTVSAIALTAALGLAGCAYPRPQQEPEFQKAPDATNIPKTVLGRDGEFKPVTVVPVSPTAFIPVVQDASTPLPDITVRNLTLNAVDVLEAVRLLVAMAKNQNVNLAIISDLDQSGDKTARRPITVDNLAGPLGAVLPRICAAGGVYCVHRDGVITISNAQTYIVPLPPVFDNPETVQAAIEQLTGSKPSIDINARALTFRATLRDAPAIHDYFRHLRENRAMIIFDTWIWEVQLTDTTRTGIRWALLAKRIGDAGLVVNAPTSITQTLPPLSPSNGLLSFGAVLSNSAVTAETIFNFLQTQGSIQTISQPQISLVNGTATTFEVGGKRKYVSEVGTVTSGSTTSTQTTVRTDDILTGLKMKVSGDIWDDTIWSNVDISITDLVEIREVATNQTTIQLPETANRVLRNFVRIRPGDMMVMAGINQSRDDRQLEGPPGLANTLLFASRNDKSVRNTELVLVMRPRIIRYEPVTAQPAPVVPTPAPTQGSIAPPSDEPTVEAAPRIPVAAVPLPKHTDEAQ